eukprot:GFKZ01000972.1.p1 GENE.GFKZ01000972.1~~GFKZ01000972.1.p1  ORF type:complete len:507 (-),score=63.15 GFKZ01000972.1:502-2022(-)
MRSSDQPNEPPVDSRTVRTNADLDLSPNKPFLLPKKRNFKPQYSHVYFSRLKCLSASVLATAKKKFGEENEGKLKYASRISDIGSTKDAEVVIVGVIFRHMSSKPSILAQYELPSHDLIPAPPPRSTSTYVGENDVVYVEDGFGRCAVDLSALDSASVHLSFTTGFVLALKGREDRLTGSFKVTAFGSVGPAPQKPITELATDKYVCVISGLSLGKNNADSLPAELLLEFLAGNSGDEEEEAASAAIVQLVIAGNLVPKLENTESGASAVLQPHRPVQNGEKERVAGPIYQVDRFLSAAAATIPVAVMPGEADPVNYLMPQQPYHRCLLPSSSRNANLARVTNPFACTLDGRHLLGTAGQNVTDLALYEKGRHGMSDGGGEGTSDEPSAEKVLDILELLLRNRHIAPTCPDTLASFPFANGKDPFVLHSTPHVFFAGGQKEFGSRMFQLRSDETLGSSFESMDIDGLKQENKVRLISVPRFDETGWAVLVNLRTLDIEIREFALTF